MADVTISETLWAEFVALAQSRRRRPEALAENVLREYLQRVADENLVEETARAARRTKFHIEDTEELIRQYRHKKSRTTRNGGPQKPNKRGN